MGPHLDARLNAYCKLIANATPRPRNGKANHVQQEIRAPRERMFYPTGCWRAAAGELARPAEREIRRVEPLAPLLGAFGVALVALPVVLVGAVLATPPWMAGRQALEAQHWQPRVGTAVETSAPLDQWTLIVDTATTSSCGVTAQDLAAIAKTESDFGRNMATNTSGHFGYGQFDAATWATFGAGDPYNPADALPAITRTLCARGYAWDRTRALNSYGGCTTATCLGTTDYATQIAQLGATYIQPPQQAAGASAGTDVLAIAHDWL